MLIYEIEDNIFKARLALDKEFRSKYPDAAVLDAIISELIDLKITLAERKRGR